MGLAIISRVSKKPQRGDTIVEKENDVENV
jgi:hypothetical protein